MEVNSSIETNANAATAKVKYDAFVIKPTAMKLSLTVASRNWLVVLLNKTPASRQGYQRYFARVSRSLFSALTQASAIAELVE
jgi:hypothetical protein